MMTFNNFYQLFYNISAAHKQLKNYGFGDKWEIEGTDSSLYPRLWVLPLSSVTRQNVQERTFNIMVFDQVHKDEDNENEVLSDCESILNDIIKVLLYENDEYTLVNEPQMTPFTEAFGDNSTGWQVEVIVQTPFNNNYCDLPMLDFISPVVPGTSVTPIEPSPGLDCDALATCPIIIAIQSDITIIQNDITTLQGQLGDYLPLAGGTMQGSIRYPQGTGVDFYDSTGTVLKSGITFNGSTTYFLALAASQTLRVDFNAVNIGSANGQGAVYIADYSTGFVNNSLVSKLYVDNAIASAAPNITASNGLTKTLNDIALGGTLNTSTSIIGQLYDFTLDVNNLSLFAQGFVDIYGIDQVRMSTNDGAISIYNTAVTITDNGTDNRLTVQDDMSQKGLVYTQDYSPNFTNESLVSKRYVDRVAATLGQQEIYMLSGVNSDIAGYESMPSLVNYTVGALATVTTSVTTTPTLLATFATPVGYPNLTTIPAGIIGVHFETQKAAGSNNYYTYFELYKRTSGGVETLLLTSDNSSQSALNTVIQQTLTGFLTSNTTLNASDRLVIKIYGVMLSASANITLRYDDNTDARLYITAPGIDLSNIKRASFGVGFMKGAGAITTSDTGTLIMPCSGTITGWQIVECSDTPVSSSIVIDVYKGTYAGYQPTTSIAGTEKPTLSSAIKNEDTTLSTWTTSFNTGDIFKFKVDSVTGAKNILLTIYYTKS